MTDEQKQTIEVDGKVVFDEMGILPVAHVIQILPTKTGIGRYVQRSGGSDVGETAPSMRYRVIVVEVKDDHAQHLDNLKKAIQCDCPAECEVGVQYRGTIHDYDGISEWQCEKCGRRWGRWTKKELQEGEFEERYGGKK